MKQINHSHLTAKERDKISFPAKWLLEKKLLVGNVLDFGCGFGSDVKFLNIKGVKIIGFDKYYYPDYPTTLYDTIMCNYVLNVLQPDEQPEVLMSVAELLKPGGKAYFTVRRDLKHEGLRVHKIHKKTTYQCKVKLPFRSILKNEFSEIYEYQHYNLNFDSIANCIFCKPSHETQLISETATTYAIFDKYPVSEGHALIIPKRHISDYFEMSIHEQRACWLLVNRCKDIIQRTFHPDGFNVGINIGSYAGQSISHAHIHLIPRYENDVDNPFGGVRGVIPEKRFY